MKITPNSTGPRNRRVAAILHDGMGSFEFGIVAEIFALERPELGVDWYKFTALAEDRSALKANGGVLVTPQAGLEALKGVGTIVIPGWPTDGVPPSERLARSVLDAHARGARILTICSGVFLPASIGMLDGRKVTTHWRYADRLRQLYPGIQVDADVLYIDEGDILTSAGSAAGIDLLLYVIGKDFGSEIANHVARRMVVPPHRQGSQAQFIERPLPKGHNSQLSKLLDAIRAAPGEHWTIAKMARDSAMSERTFIRRFNESVGCSPGDWLVRVRVELAQQLLEEKWGSVEHIAQTAGFGSVAALRHHFRTRLGLTPGRYRASFAYQESPR